MIEKKLLSFQCHLDKILLNIVHNVRTAMAINHAKKNRGVILENIVENKKTCRKKKKQKML